jgi:hypothetical protein
MKASVKIIRVENKCGNSKKTGNDYDMNFLHVMDTDNFDKFNVVVPKDEVAALRNAVGKSGVLELCVNPKTDKLEYSGFKSAA